MEDRDRAKQENQIDVRAQQEKQRQKQQALKEAARQLARQQAEMQKAALMRQTAGQQTTGQQRVHSVSPSTAHSIQGVRPAEKPEARQVHQAISQPAGGQTLHGRQEPKQPVLSQTKEIQNRLIKEVASMMEEESFGDLVSMHADSSDEEPVTEKMKNTQTKKEERKRERKDDTEDHGTDAEEKIQKWGKIGQWFQTFCWMHIPVIGFWYMVVLAVRKKTPEEKKSFARAFVLYRVLVLLLALTVLFIFYKMGVSFLEQILYYVDNHS